MTDLEQARRQLLADLGYKPLHWAWAKLEIAFGLLVVALSLGLLLPRDPAFDLWIFVAGVVLFILGGYLALAGHRSHLYQSLNDRTAYLLGQMRRPTERTEAP
jgi:hypothetical protein